MFVVRRRPGGPTSTKDRRYALRQVTLRIGAPVAVLAVILSLWQSGVFYSLFGLQEYTVPTPATIASTLANNWSSIWSSQLTTLLEAVWGYVIGNILGFVMVVFVIVTGVGRRLLTSVAGALNALPIVATAPIAVLYLGFGVSSKIAIVAILTAAVMILNSYKGLTSTDTDQLSLMHSYSATRWQIVAKLRVPSALPFIFTALKYNVPLALVGAIIAEFFGGYGGVGIEMVQALSSFGMTTVWAAMVLVGITGIIWYQAVTGLEWLVTRWYPSNR